MMKRIWDFMVVHQFSYFSAGGDVDPLPLLLFAIVLLAILLGFAAFLAL